MNSQDANTMHVYFSMHRKHFFLSLSQLASVDEKTALTQILLFISFIYPSI